MRIPAAFAVAGVVLFTIAVGVPPACFSKDKKPVDQAAVNAAISKGNQCYARQDFAGAISAYEKADKLSQRNCIDCLLAICRIYKRAGALNYALDETKKAIKEAEAANDKIAAARAHLSRGILLSELAGNKPTDKKLADAIAETREVITLDPSQTMAHYNLGVLLMRQEKDAEGAAELKAYAASPSANPASAKRAALYISNPLYAREPIAPDFSFATLEGAQISLAALKGKVTLLDFWGTWCPPCRESIPTMLQLHRKLANKPVEIVGVSSDSDEKAWRTFIAAHHMDWPEYIDLSDTVQQIFQVDAFPTYIVIDAQGVICFRQSGFNEMETGGELEDAINKALKEKPPREKEKQSSQRVGVFKREVRPVADSQLAALSGVIQP